MQLHFIRPQWLLSLLPLAWLWWRMLRRQQHDAGHWRKVCDAHLLPHLLGEYHALKTSWPVWLLGIGWLLVIFALAGPAWSRIPQPVYRAASARVIVLDLSPAMLQTDIAPNRITRAKYKILDILSQSREGQTGMIVFSGESYMVSPLTDDSATIQAMVPELTPNIMPVSGNALNAALEKAEKLLQQAAAQHAQIMVLTANPADAASLTIARRLYQQGTTISVLAVSTEKVAGLEELAQIGHGHFAIFSNDDSDLNSLLSAPIRYSMRKAQQQMAELWQDKGHWLIIFLLPIGLLAFRRNWLEAL